MCLLDLLLVLELVLIGWWQLLLFVDCVCVINLLRFVYLFMLLGVLIEARVVACGLYWYIRDV